MHDRGAAIKTPEEKVQKRELGEGGGGEEEREEEGRRRGGGGVVSAFSQEQGCRARPTWKSQGMGKRCERGKTSNPKHGSKTHLRPTTQDRDSTQPWSQRQLGSR